jgi:hypothetical protein
MRRAGFTGDIWPDETQELLLRAALLPGAPGVAAWTAARPQIDVDRLPSELHRLIPLLAKVLTARGVDDPELPRLKGVYQFSWYRNQLLFADAATLLAVLEAAGVPTMLLRGAAMVVAYHGDAGARPMNDLDVLVRPSQVEHREAAVTLRNRQGRVVRLHWQPSRNMPLPDVAREPMWQRSIEVTLGHTATRVPDPADYLVQACIDGARANSGSTLRWITDVTVLLGAVPDLDWDLLASEARRHHVSLLVAEALRYLVETLDVDVPRAAIGAMAAAPTSPRERVAHRLSLTTSPRVTSAAELLGRFTRMTADLPLPRAAATAPTFLQTMLGVERRRDLPVAVARKAVRALVSPSPALTSLSTAGSAVTGRQPTRDRP